MGNYSYITNRTLEDENGKVTGKIRVLVRKGSTTAEVDYICPKCKHNEHTEKEWKKPFSVKCSACGYLIRVPSLKSQIKREKKKAKMR